MRVDRVSPAPAPAAPRAAPGAAGFAALLDSAAEARAAEAPPAAMLAGGIFAATERDGAVDQQARRHARAMLQALAALQLAVLDGQDGAARVALAGLASQAAQAEDPVLRLILREIGVRAAVELARGNT